MYLCGMIYLKTPLSELSTRQIRMVMCETIKWCETNLGRRYKSSSLRFQCLTSKSNCDMGMYDPTTNVIKVFRNNVPDVRGLIRVVIHEYAHFLQDMRSYRKLYREHGYMRHPQEVEARKMEKWYSICWKKLKSIL